MSPVTGRSQLAICTGVPRVVAGYVRRVVVSVLRCSSWQRRCRPRFTLRGTIGVGLGGKGMQWNREAASPGRPTVALRGRR